MGGVVKLHSATETVNANKAKIMTPLGVKSGLIFPGSPRLLPDRFFDEFRKTEFVTHDGKQYKVERDPKSGTLVMALSARARRKKKERAAEEKEDAEVEKWESTGGVFDDRSPSDTSSVEPIELDFSGFFVAYNVLDEKYATHLGCGCEICKRAKMTFAARRRNLGEKPKDFGEVVVADLCTHLPNSFDGETILFVAKDLASGFLFCKPLRSKQPAGIKSALLELHQTIEEIRQSVGLPRRKVWKFHTDAGGEFSGTLVQNCLSELNGIWVDAPKGRHIPAAEQSIRNILDGLRVEIESAGLSERHWNKAAKTWVRNMNLRFEFYKEYLKSIGSDSEIRCFGNLVFAKLEANSSRSKAAPTGTPCAFLAHEGRRHISVAYQDAVGTKLSHTTVDYGSRGEGVQWASPNAEGKPTMAFMRVYRNLKPLTVQFSLGSQLGHVGMSEKEMENWLAANPLVESVLPESDCAACRGRNRKHTRIRGCLYAGLDQEQEGHVRKILSSEGAQKALEVSLLLQKSNARVVKHTSKPRKVTVLAAQELSGSPHEETVQEAHEPSGNFVLQKETVQEAHEPTVSLDSEFAEPSERLGASEGLSAAEESGQGVQEARTMQAKVADFVSELDSARLEQKCDFDGIAEAFFSGVAEAFLTRKMSPEEKRSDAGKAALKSEMQKLSVTYEAIAAPVEQESAASLYPDSTVSLFALLSFMKHAESNKPVHKGRGVVLGDKIKNIKTNAFASCESGAWNDMTTALAALEEGRYVDAFALINKYIVEQGDVEAAYLQEEWPAEVAPHFLIIPADLWEYLPEHLRPPEGMTRPVFRMKRMIYGHPKSGHVFVHRMAEWLRSKGWISVGKGALFLRGLSRLCMYVDDLKIAGPKSERESFWAEVRERYPLRKEDGGIDVQEASEFLGTKQTMTHSEEESVLEYSMRDYCLEVGKQFEKLYPDRKVRPSSVPLANSLRTKPAESKPPDRRVQILVGMLIWLARTARPELSLVASTLGSRVASWSAECEVELERTVGFVVGTAAWTLRMVVRHGEKLRPVLYTDADWHSVRSQSGSFFCLESESGNSLIPLLWSSKRQGVVATSAAAAETIAAFQGLSLSLPLFDAMYSDSALVVKIDNSQVLSLVKNGVSDKLYFTCKSANVRANALAELQARGVVSFEHCRTNLQKADLYTKVLERLKFQGGARSIGLNLVESERGSQWKVYNAFVAFRSTVIADDMEMMFFLFD